MYITIMMDRITYLFNPASVAKIESCSGISLRVKKYPKMWAPIKMRKTMAVVRVVCARESVRLLQVRRLFTTVMTKAPKAPTPAASVGVNQPVYNPPITIKKSKRILQVSLRE
jgi:hypothetical protein